MAKLKLPVAVVLAAAIVAVSALAGACLLRPGSRSENEIKGSEPPQEILPEREKALSVEKPPGFDDTVRWGDAYFREGVLDRALEQYNAALTLFPNHPDTLDKRGFTLANLGRDKEALKDYNRSLELRPDGPDALSARGVTLGRLGQYEEAMKDFNRSLERRPDHAPTLDNRGNALVALGRHEEALRDFNRSLELRPDHPGPLYNRARLFSLMGRFGEAITDLGKAIQANPRLRERARGGKEFDRLRADPEFGPQFEKLVAEESK